ncbi:Phospholipase [Methylocella tundrae]|uniref:Phospholipase n=1 Tax=Methylocella tundrae TaxID=227605 RepID=A0A8B6M850_METTU|nr:prolyl oligopeptidase family serine peptidase [Methylocella tundrae]VTZ26413.1 Phospholipase [Methylocella tundrae]VTZ51070.1 Phospholipase [Methylocella tundrae]
MTIALDGPRVAPLAGGRPESLVVLLHGIGANGDDLIDLAQYWGMLLPRTEFISLNAPFACDFAPDRLQWFSVADRAPAKLLEGARTAAKLLDPCLDTLLAERGLAPERLALVGFSQGAMMALHVGLRRKEQIAAIVAFSGALRDGAALRAEIGGKPPVLLIHGEADDIIPFASMAEARAVLEALGVPVAVLARPGLGHSIDEEGLIAGGSFLRERLSPGTSERQ